MRPSIIPLKDIGYFHVCRTMARPGRSAPGKNGRAFNSPLTMSGEFCPMRINERPSTAGVSPAGGTSRVTQSGARFTLGDPGGAARVGAVQAAAPAGAIDGLLAIQASGERLEARRRAIRRGRGILDGLDRLKIGLLSGAVSQADLLSIRAQLMQQREQSDDPRLNDLLAQVDLRAEVELAKLEKR